MVGCVRNQDKSVSDFGAVDQAGVVRGEVEIRDAITGVCRCSKRTCGVGDLAAVQLAAEGSRIEGEEGSTGAGVNAVRDRVRCMRDKRTIDDALISGAVEGEIRNAGTLGCTAVEGAGMIYGGAVNHTR